MWDALKNAQAYDFVKEKQGLDTEVAQNGNNFSGGQKQRLTIARAIVKKPEVLILDDSSSALDYATEAKLRTAIKNLEYSPTLFIVSQRTSSILHADIILVLDDGEIVGSGTHDELLQSCEIYRDIYHSQFEKEVDEDEKE
jgi:ABC-type multidrug transport system fused ATPase/permease subunit